MILIEFAPLYFKSNFIFEETNNSCFCQVSTPPPQYIIGSYKHMLEQISSYKYI